MTVSAKKVIFYFPWKEVSGGPFYLSRLARALAEDKEYEVFYSDYENGLTDKYLEGGNVKKIKLSEGEFKIYIKEPVILLTPIYWAHWIPSLHPESKILFFNWHICCLPVLRESWGVEKKVLKNFLNLIHKKDAIFFCDYSHWLGQCFQGEVPPKNFVPIPIYPKKEMADKQLINDKEINIAVLGRLCADKISSVLNLLNNLVNVKTNLKKRVIVIGGGPEAKQIKKNKFKDIEIIMTGTVTGDDLVKFLTKKVDLLFAMGTSILEGASVGLPSVIIPHSMKKITCNSFVYINDSKYFCLGWPDDQILHLKFDFKNLESIIDDIYKKGLKSEIGLKAYRYFLNNHTIEQAIVPLKKYIEKSQLKAGELFEFQKGVFSTKRKLKVGSLDIVKLERNKAGLVRLRLFNFLSLFELILVEIPGVRVLKVLKIPLFKLIGNQNRLRLNLPMEKYLRKEFAGLQNMNMCEDLLTEKSLQNFGGDIKSKYLELIKGLDERSINTITLTLSRLRHFIGTSVNEFRFTEFEKKELMSIYDKHASRILKLSDDCYSYGRYLLPKPIISTTIFYYNHFLKELNRRDAMVNREIIDVGGFIGDSAVVLSGYTKKYVHVFEPVREFYELCGRTVQMNCINNVKLINLALGNMEEQREIVLAGDKSRIENGENESLPKAKKEIINVCTLDKYVDTHNLQVGLIKVDVEGFEQSFLKGAEKTIKTQRPALLISIYHNFSDFFDIKPMIDSWGLGYKFKVVKPSDKNVIVDTILICEVQ